jgi:hypothetical protein
VDKLAANKRRSSIALSVAPVALIGALWWLVVAPLRATVEADVERLAEVRGKLQNARRTIQIAEQIGTELRDASRRVQALEQGMAQGDCYRWLLSALLAFQGPFDVEITHVEQPALLAQAPLPPKVPYKAATSVVTGVGAYHSFGFFLADFENRYPLIRLQSLELEPAPYVEVDPKVPGKLTFKLKLLVLVKPTGPGP